jgi:type IV secretory pathway VirB10-like protein
MHLAAACVLVSALGLGQASASEAPQQTPGSPPTAAATTQEAPAPPAANVKASPAPGTVIPAGTKVALSLKQAISTKTAKEGDAVYAETTFPVAIDSKMIIPPGTYVQGKISQVKRGGHVKGRAELLIHFTSMIYPNGYTVMLPGSLENVPGAEKSTVKNEEGTIQQDSQTGEKIGTAAKTAGAGAAIGGIAGGWKGAGIGAGVGGLAGAAIGMLSRGADVRLEPGTSVEMVIQREVPLDTTRIHLASN